MTATEKEARRHPCAGCGYYYVVHGSHRADCTAKQRCDCGEPLRHPESIRAGRCYECRLCDQTPQTTAQSGPDVMRVATSPVAAEKRGRFRLLFSHDELIELGRCTTCGWHPPTQGHQIGCGEGPARRDP